MRSGGRGVRLSGYSLVGGRAQRTSRAMVAGSGIGVQLPGSQHARLENQVLRKQKEAASLEANLDKYRQAISERLIWLLLCVSDPEDRDEMRESLTNEI